MVPPEDLPVRIKVLIIDDDKKLCRLIKDYLGLMGYDVAAAHDGIGGLKMALTGDFGLIHVTAK